MLKFDFFNGLIEAFKEKLNSWYLSPGIYDRKEKIANFSALYLQSEMILLNYL